MVAVRLSVIHRILGSGVSLNPSSRALPGSGTLQDLVNGIAFWALLAALAGLIIGATNLGARRPHEQLPKCVDRPARRARLRGSCARHRCRADAAQFPVQRRTEPSLNMLEMLIGPSGDGVAHPASGLFGFGLSALVNALFGGLSSWVESGTSALIAAFGHALTATTEVSLGAGFLTEFDVVVKVGALLSGPFLLLAVLHTIVRQDLSILLRAVFVRLPLALVFVGSP